MTKFLIILLLGLPLCLAEPIKRIQIFGERNSGTNYLSTILRVNFPQLEIYDYGENGSYGIKHWPAWVGKPISYNFRLYGKQAERFCTFPNSDDCLFIYIFRNPYDWVQAMARTPWEIAKQPSLDAFLRTPPSYNKSLEKVQNSPELAKYLRELNPDTNLPFDNILTLRAKKIENALQIKNLVKHFIILKYEDFKTDPFFFLKQINKIIPVATPENEFLDVNFDARPGSFSKKYKNKPYPPLSHENLLFINSHADWDLECLLGYAMREHN